MKRRQSPMPQCLVVEGAVLTMTHEVEHEEHRETSKPVKVRRSQREEPHSHREGIERNKTCGDHEQSARLVVQFLFRRANETERAVTCAWGGKEGGGINLSLC